MEGEERICGLRNTRVRYTGGWQGRAGVRVCRAMVGCTVTFMGACKEARVKLWVF